MEMESSTKDKATKQQMQPKVSYNSLKKLKLN